MKPNRSINWIRIFLSGLALALLIVLLTPPVLANGIAEMLDSPVESEKLDIRPIPVPEPEGPLAGNEPSAAATPSLLLVSDSISQPVPVPTPPLTAIPTATSLAESHASESFTAVKVQIVKQQALITMALLMVILFIWVWLHQASGFHSLKNESA